MERLHPNKKHYLGREQAQTNGCCQYHEHLSCHEDLNKQVVGLVQQSEFRSGCIDSISKWLQSLQGEHVQIVSNGHVSSKVHVFVVNLPKEADLYFWRASALFANLMAQACVVCGCT